MLSNGGILEVPAGICASSTVSVRTDSSMYVCMHLRGECFSLCLLVLHGVTGSLCATNAAQNVHVQDHLRVTKSDNFF